MMAKSRILAVPGYEGTELYCRFRRLVGCSTGHWTAARDSMHLLPSPSARLEWIPCPLTPPNKHRDRAEAAIMLQTVPCRLS
jgi:hypothetical protein